MSEERIPTYIPGDVIAYYVIFVCEVNVSSVSVAFRNDTTGPEIVLTGESQLAVVATTLAVAALFNPLRRRTQTFIDLRFYRKKYDTAKTLEAFSARLRDETDLDQLNTELLTVVRGTVQPQHVSLWVWEPDGGSAGTETRQ